jgi:hypothetical protein
MRIYRTKRIRREWTDADRTLAKRLYASGFSNSEIATALGRNADAVRAWVHHNCRVWQQPEVAEYPSAVVPYADVPAWYELGWRLARFDNGEWIFEWRSSGIARMPGHHSVTAAQATTALEVAA